LNNRSVANAIPRLALLGLAMLAAPAANAAVSFTVDTVADLLDDDTSDGVCHTSANSCSLRAAIMQANKLSGPVATTILLPAGIYTLARPATIADGDDNGDLNLTTPVSLGQDIAILGAGAAATIIDANQIDRVLHVAAGRAANITGVTLRNGAVPSTTGGGIYNQGTLTLTNTTVSGNGGAYFGGGIYNQGTLTLSNSTLSANTCEGAGAGVHNEDVLSVYSSTISGNNVSNGPGGGIVNNGTLLLSLSTLSGNLAYDYGGGMLNQGSADVSQSTISGNKASRGGGLYNADVLYLTNSTISSNRSDADGGGIYNNSIGATNVYNSTIAFNEADSDADPGGGSGGGVYNLAGGTFNLRNSVVAGNNVSGAPVYDECTGALGSYGRNKFWGVSGCTITQFGAGDSTLLLSLDELGGLQANGGPTQTIALVPPSDMIDGADATSGCIDKTGSVLATDQRGAPRVAGVRCDIGAFEYGSVPEPAAAAAMAVAVAMLAALARLSV
jgi:hypothetical protein